MFNSLLKDIYKKGLNYYFLENYNFNGDIKDINGYYAFDIETTNKDDKECIVYSTMIMKTDNDICYHNSSVEDLVYNLYL